MYILAGIILAICGMFGEPIFFIASGIFFAVEKLDDIAFVLREKTINRS